ncbi:MAG: transglycosylase SLT domain-containing protein [Chloroflexota bacterium]
MRASKLILVVLLGFISLAAGGQLQAAEGRSEAMLSPVWRNNVRRWAVPITAVARDYGLDPDLIAAVINVESNGNEEVISRAGAVGLMGVMPAGPGLEWRPAPEELTIPTMNLRWGVSILVDILRQSGGDLYAALAAYNGGWAQVNSQTPQEYAAQVLNDYGRAVAARSGVSPDIASRWTVAVEIPRGYVPAEPLLISGGRPVSGLRQYGEHLVYYDTNQKERAFYVKGYAVPLAIVVPLAGDAPALASSHTIEPQLLARLGLLEMKFASHSNPRVLLACVPSLNQLRGRVSTRWFAPSHCPSWHR